MTFHPLDLNAVVQLLLDEARDAISSIAGEKPPLTWQDLKEPPRFPSLIEQNGSLLTAWVLPGSPVGRDCAGPYEWPIRLRWLVCHVGFDRMGLDTTERQKAAVRTLAVAQAVERALMALTCGEKPDGVVSLEMGRSEAVRPEAKSAGWEWQISARM